MFGSRYAKEGINLLSKTSAGDKECLNISKNILRKMDAQNNQRIIRANVNSSQNNKENEEDEEEIDCNEFLQNIRQKPQMKNIGRFRTTFGSSYINSPFYHKSLDLNQPEITKTENEIFNFDDDKKNKIKYNVIQEKAKNNFVTGSIVLHKKLGIKFDFISKDNDSKMCILMNNETNELFWFKEDELQCLDS